MIKKGEAWGRPGELPHDAPVLDDDRALAAAVERGVPIVAVTSGDIARTLGVRQPFERVGPKQLLPIDALRLVLDDQRELTAVAWAQFGDFRRQRHAVAIMNAAFIDVRNIAPRAHPGDGKADVVRFAMAPTDRFKALRRMRTGTHVPHPDISVRQRAHDEIAMERPTTLWIDGSRVGRATTLRFEIIPAAITVAV